MSKTKELFFAAIAGAITGFINGIFGGGGGMIAVPALTAVFCLSVHKAHATAIFVILPLSIVSAALYAKFGAFDKDIILPVTIGVFFGGILGAKLLPQLSGKAVSIIFCLFMLFAGIRMAFF